MNVFALISLISSLICLVLGFVVLSFNKKAALNRLFFFAVIATFLYSFTTVMMWISGSYESAHFWNKMGSIWPFFVVLVVHFALVFTDSNWLKNKFTYVVLYVPAVILFLLELSTNLINGPPVLEYWGYNDVASPTLFYAISTFWSAALPILAFVICFRFYRESKEEATKQQGKLVASGFAIPIIAFIITNMLLRGISVKIPNLGIVAMSFFSLFVGYAISKYELFAFDAALATENIISTIPDSLILANMKGNIFKINKRLETFLGFNEDELLNKSITALMENNQQFITILQELPEKRTVLNHELIFRTKFGEDKTVLFSGSVVQSKTGRDIGLTCVVHDITERKEMEARLVKAERLASIGELAGQIGHDLRNPLTGIKSSAYILRKKSDRLTNEEKEMILGTIDNSVEDSNRIISSLVDYASDMYLEIDYCNLKELMQSTLSKVHVPDHIKILYNSSNQVGLSLDPTKMEKAFTGIIQNSIEAMPKEGLLTIDSLLSGSDVEILFTDTGIGIPAAILPKLFSPLITTKAKGMGMGLAICKRIVDAHGGNIWVHETSEKGTTIKVTLPIKADQGRTLDPK